MATLKKRPATGWRLCGAYTFRHGVSTWYTVTVHDVANGVIQKVRSADEAKCRAFAKAHGHARVTFTPSTFDLYDTHKAL